MPPAILLIADSGEELAPLVAAALDGRADLRRAASTDEGVRLLTANGWLCELIVVVQARPGEFTATHLQSLLRAAPLARVCRVLGSWCEGELRSGHPPAGCLAIPWQQWPAWIGRELSAGKWLSAGLPATATREERILWEDERRGTPLRRARIAIVADRFQNAEALADACRVGGYEVVEAADANVLIWDCRPEEIEPHRVSQIRALAGHAPLLAVCGFPREQDVARAVEAGIAMLVPKPWSLDELTWAIERCRVSP